jgi:hypothetical protein
MEQDNDIKTALIDFVSKTVLTAAHTSIREKGLLVIKEGDAEIINNIFIDSVDILKAVTEKSLYESSKTLNTNAFLGDILNNMAVAYKIMSEAAVEYADSLKEEDK